MMGLRLSSVLKLRWESPFYWKLRRAPIACLDRQAILLLDFAGDERFLQSALGELWPACPGKVWILSLFQNRK